MISYHAIYLHRIQVGEINTSFALVFKQYLPHRGWFDIAIPAAILFGQGGTASLCERGANFRDPKLFLDYVRATIDEWHRKNKTAMTFEQYGWKDGDTEFLLGDVLYTKDGPKQAVGTNEMQTRSQWVGPTPDGSLEEWKQCANALFAAECEPQSVAVCAGFGAPLMKFLSPNEGGAILSYVTPDTARGKTTAALGAITIWGQQKGLEIKTEFSKVVRGLTLAACGNLPVLNDELRARDPVLMRDYVLMYTGGGDKPRGTRDGHIRHAAGNWQNILITTDNYSLVELLATETEAEDAAQMRVIELPCSIPQNRKHVYGDDLKKKLQENAGHAGAAYVHWLVSETGGHQNIEWVKEELQTTYQEIYQLTGWDERHRFWARTVACCAMGGRIAVALGLVEFSVKRIVEWLIAQLQERVIVKNENWAIPTLSDYLDQHTGERLIVNAAYRRHQPCVWTEPRTGRLTIRYEQDTQRYFITRSHFKRWVTKNGRNFKNMLADLKKRGVMITAEAKITLGAGTPFSSGQKACVEIDGAHPAMTGRPRLTLPAQASLEDEVFPLPKSWREVP